VRKFEVYLLGRFFVGRRGRNSISFGCAKSQELLAFLLINRNRTLRRDWIATELWDDPSRATPRKNLRHALWKLQNALGEVHDELALFIRSDGPDWIRCEPPDNLWWDVAALESAHAILCRRSADSLSTQEAEALEEVVDIYAGQFLDGCDQHWCLIERERLRDYYTAILDALTDHCILTKNFDKGIAFAHRNLREDYAREQTHQRLMSLYALAGDRTAALRQFARCDKALRSEFDVEPSRATMALRDVVRMDRLGDRLPVVGSGTHSIGGRTDAGSCTDLLVELRNLLWELSHTISGGPLDAERGTAKAE